MVKRTRVQCRRRGGRGGRLGDGEGYKVITDSACRNIGRSLRLLILVSTNMPVTLSYCLLLAAGAACTSAQSLPVIDLGQSVHRAQLNVSRNTTVYQAAG